MLTNRIIRLLPVVLLIALCAGNAIAPAQAKPKLQSATLIKLYKKHCLADLNELKSKLQAGGIKIKGSKVDASKSSELSCPFDADNPTMKQLANAKWIADTDSFIVKVGVKAYVAGARQGMAASMQQAHVLELLAQAPKTGLSKEELLIIGRIMRAAAFTEAHVEAAQAAYKK